MKAITPARRFDPRPPPPTGENARKWCAARQAHRLGARPPQLHGEMPGDHASTPNTTSMYSAETSMMVSCTAYLQWER